MLLRIKNLTVKSKGRFVISIICVFLLFLISAFLCQRVFFINDDENIMYTIAGYYTNGIPYDHYFLNFCLSFILRGLYKTLPQVPWYGVYHVGIIFISLCSILFSVFEGSAFSSKELSDKNKNTVIPWIITVFLLVFVFFYPATLLQFTTTSAIAGTAAVAILYTMDWKTGKVTVLLSILQIVLILLCYMQRKKVGYVFLCFYYCTIAYLMIKAFLYKRCGGDKKTLVRIGLSTIIVTGLLLSVICIDHFKRDTEMWNNFKDYDTARFHVTDYPHDSFEDNRELYDQIGWNAELYELTGREWWYFMDPKVNTTAFEMISQSSKRIQNDENTNIKIITPIDKLFQSGFNEKVAIIIFVILTVCMIIMAFCFRKRQIVRLEICYGLMIVVISYGMLFYLCFRQRLPFRAFQTLFFPFTVLLILVFEKVKDEGGPFLSRLINRKNVKTAGLICLCIGFCILGKGIIKEVISLSNDRFEKSSRELMIEEYAINNKDSFFVYDTSLTFRYNPFIVYIGNYPSNLMFWGGMGWNSPAFFSQLQYNGLTGLNNDVMFNKNVYYITYNGFKPGGKTMKERYFEYLKTQYPDMGAELVDVIQDTICVYKIYRT